MVWAHSESIIFDSTSNTVLVENVQSETAIPATSLVSNNHQPGPPSPSPSLAECVPYYYPDVDSRLPSFPPIWEPASILSGDTNAEAKWESIKPAVPNITTKGTISGDVRKVVYHANDTDCWWTYSKCTRPKVDGLPRDVAEIPEPYTLAYAFDDGPNCSHNAFYDYLQSQEQQATMFYIGSNVMDWPREAKRAVTDGHEICVHTWSHRYMTAFSNRDAFAELYYTMQAIKLVTGVTPTCWRPPYGDVDDRIRAIAHGLGLQTILWKYDSNDWRVGESSAAVAISKDKVDANYEALLKEAEKGTFSQSGAILLAHELNNFTMSEAIKYHKRLKNVFRNIVPFAVALNRTQPYVEEDITVLAFDDWVTHAISGGNMSSDRVGDDLNSLNGPPVVESNPEAFEFSEPLESIGINLRPPTRRSMIPPLIASLLICLF